MIEVTGSNPTAPRFTYVSQEFDAATGLYYYWHRWYDATTGRWTSVDPIGFAAGDVNLYRYVGNSPVIYIDPTGLTKAKGNQGVLTSLASMFNPGITAAVQLGKMAYNAATFQGSTEYHSPDGAWGVGYSRQGSDVRFGSYNTSGGSTSVFQVAANPSGVVSLNDLYAGNTHTSRAAAWNGQTSTITQTIAQTAAPSRAFTPEYTVIDSDYSPTPPPSNQQIDSPAWAATKAFAGSIWDSVKFWDNESVSTTYSNARASGQGVVGAAYTAVGNAAGEFVGLSSIVDGLSGRDIHGNELTTLQRMISVGSGTVSLVGTAAGIGAVGKTGTLIKKANVYDVDTAAKLRNHPLRNTQAHHVPQSREAELLVGDFKQVNRKGREPAIRLPITEHEAVTAAQKHRTAPASARDLLADEIRILRNNTNAPNSALRRLIQQNKDTHFWDYAPLHRTRTP